MAARLHFSQLRIADSVYATLTTARRDEGFAQAYGAWLQTRPGTDIYLVRLPNFLRSDCSGSYKILPTERGSQRASPEEVQAGGRARGV